jgi:hypothetical protein
MNFSLVLTDSLQPADAVAASLALATYELPPASDHFAIDHLSSPEGSQPRYNTPPRAMVPDITDSFHVSRDRLHLYQQDHENE